MKTGFNLYQKIGPIVINDKSTTGDIDCDL